MQLGKGLAGGAANIGSSFLLYSIGKEGDGGQSRPALADKTRYPGPGNSTDGKACVLGEKQLGRDGIIVYVTLQAKMPLHR